MDPTQRGPKGAPPEAPASSSQQDTPGAAPAAPALSEVPSDQAADGLNAAILDVDKDDEPERVEGPPTEADGHDEPAQEKKHTLPFIVCLGASAGGLEAISDFLEGFDHKPPMAFVVIQHLSPDYRSLLAELLAKHTTMEVIRAHDGLVIEQSTVYIIEPQTDLSIEGDHLKVTQGRMINQRSLHLPIDHFLESMAHQCGPRCAAVILSGTGSDGAQGIRAVKEVGGLVFAQDADSARFDGMPRSAAATGVVDLILPPKQMPANLVRSVNHLDVIVPQVLFEDDHPAKQVLNALKQRTGVDFSSYKENTLARRLERRMSLRGIEDPRDYAKTLRDEPSEATQLYRDMLIGVTRFFRDPEAVEQLRRTYIPQLLERFPEDEVIRVWTTGCSTGEEAYTLAILLQEALDARDDHRTFKLFATDIDQRALDFATRGRYPINAAIHVPQELLQIYFDLDGDAYRIKDHIRERMLFSRHNITYDPPFSRLHLVSCRNLLIYLKPDMQDLVLRTFAFALLPDALMWLGASESVANNQHLFTTLDNRWKIFRSNGAKALPMSSRQSSINARHSSYRQRPPLLSQPLPKEGSQVAMFYQGLTDRYLPPTVAISEDLQLVYTHGDLRDIVQTSNGFVDMDARRMLPIEISARLPAILERAKETHEELLYPNLEISKNRVVTMRARMIKALSDAPLLALIFESFKPTDDDAVTLSTTALDEDTKRRMELLEYELNTVRQRLQATIEELESSNEELQAANEELLSANEELQSTNEELQSVNEELQTVNHEHQLKISELMELNADHDSLLESINVGTLYLDERLNIRRYNTLMTRYISLKSSDIGRPLGDLTHRLNFDSFEQTCRQVLHIAKTQRVMVTGLQSEVVLITISSANEDTGLKRGLVLTFADITEARSKSERLELMSQAFHQTSSPMLLLGPGGQIAEANQQFCALLDTDPEFIEDCQLSDVLHPDDFEMIRHTLAQDEQTWRGILQFQRPDREVRSRLCNLIPMPETGNGTFTLLSVQTPAAQDELLHRPPSPFILLVEDSEHDYALVQRSLRKHRIVNSLLRVRTAREALELLRLPKGQPGNLQRPLILLLDLNLPGMSGLDLMRMIKDRPEAEGVAVFIYSDSREKADVDTAYSLGAKGFISKDSVGEDFVELMDMFDAYWRLVEMR